MPARAWHLDGRCKDTSDMCLDTVIKLGGKMVDLTPPKPFVVMMEVFKDSLVDQPPWRRIMPKQAHQSFVKRLVEATLAAMEGAPFDYYKTVWRAGNNVIKSLVPSYIDRSEQEKLIKSGEGNQPAIRSFEVGSDGFVSVPCYNRFKTLTGRLVIDQGPQILTLKRDHRKMIKSRYGNAGSVIALDFAALEARILLYEHGRSCIDSDLYGMLARELGYERKVVKGAVIARLYGMADKTLSANLGIESSELTTFLRKFDSYFNTDELLSRLKSQFIASGHVTNRYGRKIVVDDPHDNIFISYYGQSTGVDVTMLGFNQIIERMKADAPSARPVFLLHDSVLVDVLNDELSQIRAIQHVKVKGYVQKFIMRFEQI